jgi:hypothetical protein
VFRGEGPLRREPVEKEEGVLGGEGRIS